MRLPSRWCNSTRAPNLTNLHRARGCRIPSTAVARVPVKAFICDVSRPRAAILSLTLFPPSDLKAYGCMPSLQDWLGRPLDDHPRVTGSVPFPGERCHPSHWVWNLDPRWRFADDMPITRLATGTGTALWEASTHSVNLVFCEVHEQQQPQVPDSGEGKKRPPETEGALPGAVRV